LNNINKSIFLYHWSPRSRKNQILRYGLKPGVLSRDREWRPPRICLALTPSQAWGSLSCSIKSGDNCDDIYYDLWQTSTDRLNQPWEVCQFSEITEYRIYERVYKRNLWWVGERRL